MCIFENCNLNGKRKYNGRCCLHKNYKNCDMSKCQNLTESEFCRLHTCSFDTCQNYSDPDETFCKYHRKKYQCNLNQCQNLIRNECQNCIYCPFHTCSIDKCHNLKNGLQFCYKHSLEYTCSLPRCDGLTFDGGRLCNYHRCNVEECQNIRKFNCAYCTNHTCAYFRCKNQVLGNYATCGYHHHYDNRVFEMDEDRMLGDTTFNDRMARNYILD